ncbi:MAG: segregation/condensation protein A [Desulfobacterota bacterium]|nr:segregation/condensation protein A [Thermodesulfobacteriota bacterium]MDW8001928.1 segregation/condensation protein A [Deltaproteobacteria bacterium]
MLAELLIPSLNVRLASYEGPLSVIPLLVKRNRLSIWEVPLCQITEKFMDYVEAAREMNLKIVEEFIDVVSLLMVLKSRALINFEEKKNDVEEKPLENICEHEVLKKWASVLEELPLLNRDTFNRGRSVITQRGDFDLYNLFMTFFEIVKREQVKCIEIKPIKPALQEIFSELEEKISKRGIYIFDATDGADLSTKIATVLSMLEMVKRKVARIIQYRPFGKIILKRRETL